MASTPKKLRSRANLYPSHLLFTLTSALSAKRLTERSVMGTFKRLCNDRHNHVNKENSHLERWSIQSRRGDIRTKSPGQPRIFYGWWVVLGGAGIVALSGGLNFYGFSALFVPLSQEFGWNRSVLAGVFALSRLEGGFLGPIEGILVDKFGSRRMMFIGIPVMGIGFILLSQINSLLTLYAVYIGFITVGSGFGTFAPVSAAIANWFVKNRSKAFGFLMSGTGIGGAVLLPILGWWITTYGWRNSVIASGILILVAGLPIACIVRHRPEQYGMFPDGDTPTVFNDVESPDKTENQYNTQEGIQPEFGGYQAFKTSSFWLFGISLGLRSIVTTGFIIHFVAMMVDRGLSLTSSTSLLGSVALISLIGRIGIGGWIGDVVSKRYLLAGTTAVMAMTMIAIGQTQEFWMVAVILIIYSVAYGASVVLPMGLQADYFGRQAFATIRGMLHTLQTIGMIFGPVFAGLVYDITDSYFTAFLGFGAAAGLAALCLIFLRKPTLQPNEYPKHSLESHLKTMN